MRYRRLGKTGLMVSEVGLGAEWFDRHTQEECSAIVNCCMKQGINIMDVWMPGPKVRSMIGEALDGNRDKWYIEGHVGATWQNEQYVRSRDLKIVKPAFEDLLKRLKTDYIDLGMIHYVDKESELEGILNGPFIKYVEELKRSGTIHHIGLSTHNPAIAKKVVELGIVEMILFSINPAFDLHPATENAAETYYGGAYDEKLSGINEERAELYRLCEQNDVGITVMKGFAGGRLLKAESSPFEVALTPVKCIHYALTRPAVASIMVGYDTTDHVLEAVSYETASEEEKDYASVLANAPHHAFHGQCTYCGHCKPCPVNIDIAMVNKLSDLADMQPMVPESAKQHYLNLDVYASSCLECHGCEDRCPFGVPVVEKMKHTVEQFGI